MKGKKHERIAISFAIFFAIIIILLLTYSIPIISGFVEYIGILWFSLALLLFILGSILPDSDSENMGSYIYFRKVWGIGYLFKLLEFPISKVLNRKRGHRQSLHTIYGIAFTSVILIVILSSIIGFLGFFQLRGAITGLIFLFLGQLLHLICDLQEGWSGWKISLK